MSSNLQWMYKRLIEGLYNLEFVKDVQKFLEFAMNPPEGRDVHGHLLGNGFALRYHVWYLHGESEDTSTDEHERMHNLDHTMNNSPVTVDAYDESGPSTSYHRMVQETVGPSLDLNDRDELPNPDAHKFYDMIDAANQEVWPANSVDT
ncbi:hypothetical protein KY290_013027 [Solanum tuberosum]|uniref:Uncharacterized protein n=1 Tax=Solanum tuberosum TaxID=4113 RepID=A0ABQ7VKK7_SOLTU|nr:hypothetical protein KY285_012794 [Solanum tuberosum]KAH0769046.1 hypothetical protein KY290_013027 [Solanum tuberosum]